MSVSDEEIMQAWAQAGLKPDYLSIGELLQYVENTRPVNPKKHRHKDIEATKGSIHTSGYKVPSLLWKNPQTGKVEVIIGSGRILAAADDGLEALPVHWDTTMTPAQAKALRLADNRTPEISSAYDDQIIIDTLKDLKHADLDLGYLKYDKYDKFLVEDLAADDPLFEDIAPGYAEMVNGPVNEVDHEARQVQSLPLGAQEPELHPPLPPVSSEELPKYHGTPSESFPSDNEYGIPSLSLKFVPDSVPKPLVKWGEISRRQPMHGCWHFYIEDSKFANLVNDPLAPLYSNPAAIVEPNFSIGSQSPKAHVIWWTYWKRFIARKLQAKGVRVFVDLNVAEVYLDLNFVGVPEGYTAYATRGYNREIAYLGRLYQAACDHAGTEDIVFLVYGGGKVIQDFCTEFSDNLTWIPERMAVVNNSALAEKDGLAPNVAYDDFKNIKK
ncbi:MAG: DUF4417 domain-containing protein [Candidatus Gastranaerophilales bacterium]|nr:DUF4417 domain-containing protein [Candidatus Gastranaerophilales bacterium]